MFSGILSVKELQEKTTPIFQTFPVNKVILFGSYAQRSASDNSDIDLYVDSGGNLRGLHFVGLLERLVNALGKEVDLIDKKHIEPDSPILQEIEERGIVIFEKSDDVNKDN
jgi:predicted nucleotidyltransferase